jgi:hypothetical protein
MSTAYSGVEANVKVAAVDLDVQGWSADVSVSTFDSTTTADGGWDDETSATKRIEWSFDFFYNPSKAPFDPGGLNLVPGTTLTGMALYVNLTDDVKLTGTGLVKKVTIKTKTKEGVSGTASGVNKGVWVLPT